MKDGTKVRWKNASFDNSPDALAPHGAFDKTEEGLGLLPPGGGKREVAGHHRAYIERDIACGNA